MMIRLSVMSFNVRGSFHEDGANNWDQRRDLNINTVTKHAPDIIGFQEAQSGNLADYEVALAGYDLEPGLLSIRQTEHYHRVPIYWKRDKFEKLDSDGFYLSETPEQWSLSWGSTFARAATWVTLRAVESGAVFAVLNTHFPHELESDFARAESARLVTRRLAQVAPEIPQIVTADFNALPDSEAYQVFLDGGYVDTFVATGKRDPVNTFHDFAGMNYAGSGGRIDWILTKDAAQTAQVALAFTTRRCTVIEDEAPPLYPSDHYPVLVELELG